MTNLDTTCPAVAGKEMIISPTFRSGRKEKTAISSFGAIFKKVYLGIIKIVTKQESNTN
jgi:hypothetical protein